MKLSVLFISTFLLVLSFSGRSQETVMNSINRHAGKIGKTVQSVGGTFSTGSKKMKVAIAPNRMGRKKPTKKVTKSKKPTKKARAKSEKFRTTDEILNSQWYTGLLPDLPRNKQVKITERKNKIPPKTVENKFVNMVTTTFPLRTHLPYPIYFSDGSSNNKKATKKANEGVKSNNNQAKSKNKRNFRANPNNNAPSENTYTNISESLFVEGLEKYGSAEHNVPSEKTKSVENIGSSEKTKLVDNIGSSEKIESFENIGSSEKIESFKNFGSSEKIKSFENIGSSEKTKSVEENGSFSESSTGKTNKDSSKVTSSSIQKNPTHPANTTIEESGDGIKGTEEIGRGSSRILKDMHSCNKKIPKKKLKKKQKKGKKNARYY